MLRQGWEWAAEKSRGSRMDPCKRRCLRCERSVVHSGKSVSRAAAAPWRVGEGGSGVVEIMRTSSDETEKQSVLIENWLIGRFEAGFRKPQRQPHREARQ